MNTHDETWLTSIISLARENPKQVFGGLIAGFILAGSYWVSASVAYRTEATLEIGRLDETKFLEDAGEVVSRMEAQYVLDPKQVAKPAKVYKVERIRATGFVRVYCEGDSGESAANACNVALADVVKDHAALGAQWRTRIDEHLNSLLLAQSGVSEVTEYLKAEADDLKDKTNAKQDLVLNRMAQVSAEQPTTYLQTAILRAGLQSVFATHRPTRVLVEPSVVSKPYYIGRLVRSIFLLSTGLAVGLALAFVRKSTR